MAPRRRVLVVEDDDDIRETLVEIIGARGYEAVGAVHGGAALQLLSEAEACPDVILLDLMMPIMDGQAFRQAQRKDPRIADIPVILMSAYQDVAERARDMQVAACLSKPLELQLLLRVVAEHAGKKNGSD